MKFVKISQDELTKVRQLYESIISYACHGLFYREGVLFGAKIAEIAKNSKDEYFSVVAAILEARGWVDSVDFEDGRATVKGSVEVKPDSETETCHRIRGIISSIYGEHLGKQIRLVESDCESLGSDNCVFIIEPDSEE